MRLNGYLLEPGDELDGFWPREQLLKMNARFTSALEQAFELGLESRESARQQVRLPTNSARFVAPLCPATQEGLFRSVTPDTTVFVRR
jgi:hypothetical protein